MLVAPTRMRILRKRRGLTQHELAVLTGIPPSRISQIENGLTPRDEHLRVLARELRVSPPELLIERTWNLDEPSSAEGSGSVSPSFAARDSSSSDSSSSE